MKKMLIVLLSVIVVSCGDNKKKNEIRLADYNHSDAYKSATETNATNKEEDVASKTADATESQVVTVSLESTDQMKFNKDEIKVPAGSTVKLTLTHTGKLPANVMGHNFVLLRKGTDLPSFTLKAVDFPKNDYIPEKTNAVIAHTKIIGGGESVSIEFKAPKPGIYPFICSFPGHYTMMKGTFIVE